jgi:threonine synthase
MTENDMSIVGFVPNPETATTVVAWVQALADKDEGKTFLCYETGFEGRTAQAVHEALGKERDGVATVTPIDDPMPAAVVWAYCARETAVSS